MRDYLLKAQLAAYQREGEGVRGDGGEEGRGERRGREKRERGREGGEGDEREREVRAGVRERHRRLFDYFHI